MFYKLCFFLFGLTVVSAGRVKFFRKDYTYLDEYDAFFKVHTTNLSSWNYSFLTCDDEESELFYPATDVELAIAAKIAQVTPVEDEIFVGIHDKFVTGEFLSVNGRPMNITVEQSDNNSEQQHCVTLNIRTGVYRVTGCDVVERRPFICKKVEDTDCPTIDKGYKYVSETRKCYKLNKHEKTWSKAIETCYMEGGTLAVVESEMESKILAKIIAKYHEVHAGFKKPFQIDEFYTVKGHKLQDTGFNKWRENEGHSNNNHEQCGAIVGYYSDNNRDDANSFLLLTANDCDMVLKPFICEMDI